MNIYEFILINIRVMVVRPIVSMPKNVRIWISFGFIFGLANGEVCCFKSDVISKIHTSCKTQKPLDIEVID